MATLSQLDERSRNQAHQLENIEADVDGLKDDVNQLKMNWARLMGLAAGAAAAGGIGGGGIVALIARTLGHA